MDKLVISHREFQSFGTTDERLTKLGWVVVRNFGQHRDSDSVSVSNCRVLMGRLSDADPDETGHSLMHCGHWAVGWVDHILIDPKRDDLMAVVREAQESYDIYPLLSEDDHSELEMEWHNEGICQDGCSRCEGEKEDHRRGECGDDCHLCADDLQEYYGEES